MTQEKTATNKVLPKRYKKGLLKIRKKHRVLVIKY